MVSCSHFVFYMGAKGGVVVSDGAGGDVLFAAFSDYCVEMFDG